MGKVGQYGLLGKFERAIEAYDRSCSLDPKAQHYFQKLGLARRSLLVKQVQDLLSSYQVAYEDEDAALLASLLDETKSDFVVDQISNAEKLFREFDAIDVSLSDATIQGNEHDGILVGLQLSMSAAFAETGVAVTLLDTNQTLTLRKEPEAGWKICEIQ